MDDQLIHTWQLHLIIGWDSAIQTYTAVMVDNNGFASLLRGTVQNDRLTMTLHTGPGATGQTLMFRFIWDAGEPDVIGWTNESSIDGRHWKLIEHYRMVAS